MSNPSTQTRLYRPADARGAARISWLESYHTFSFGDFHDPQWMGFGDLQVINDDRVQPAQGFGTHGHRDMEIITIMLSGVLSHKDSMGNVETITPGEIQRMTAGTGVRHSEFNASETDIAHLLQIWIHPAQKDLEPGYEQNRFNTDLFGDWQMLVTPENESGGIVIIHQNAKLSLAQLKSGQSVPVSTNAERRYWIHVATGDVIIDGQTLTAGSAIGLVRETAALTISGQSDTAQVLLFDLAL